MFKKTNEVNFRQKICYRFPKQNRIDQIKNVFTFDLEPYSEKEYATPYAVGLYDVIRLRNLWNIDLTLEEIETRKKISFLNTLTETLSCICLTIFQKTMKEMKGYILIKMGMSYLARIDF